MLTKEVQYTVFDSNNEEVERTDKVRFMYSLPALRLYEQRTGRNFFDDNMKAVNAFSASLQKVGAVDTESMTEAQQLEFLPLMMQSDIMKFTMDAIPCLYGEVENGRLVQNDLTVQNAEMSPWIDQLLNVEFFAELVKELNKFRGKVPQDRKKPQAK